MQEIVDKDKVMKTLQTIYFNNVQKFADGKLGKKLASLGLITSHTIILLLYQPNKRSTKHGFSFLSEFSRPPFF